MPDQLIRRVPPDLQMWIDRESSDRRKSKQEFLIETLQKARDGQAGDQLSLFAAGGNAHAQSEMPPFIPFKFIDLFAGIGGFRQAMERLGGECRFSVEWDRYCQKTYAAWYGSAPVGDIRSVVPEDIPPHDILTAGFPCQPFSIAGVSKKNSLGRAHGFDCENQGNLFFVLAGLIEAKRPPIILLENVKNLKSHDGGRTWAEISRRLRSLEYDIHAQVIDAAGWVPQHRERIYIVGFDKRRFGPKVDFTFPTPPAGPRPALRDILEADPDPKYTLSDLLWSYLQGYAKKHQEKGNGFGFGLADPDGVTRTLSARYYKDGSEILIPQEYGNPRRLTPRECQRLMGFEDRLPIEVSDTQAYRQFGNAVVPKVAEAVGRQILRVVARHLLSSETGCLLNRGVLQ